MSASRHFSLLHENFSHLVPSWGKENLQYKLPYFDPADIGKKHIDSVNYNAGVKKLIKIF